MAGIGFELKHLFGGQGLLRKLRAYGYAGIVCSGSTLMAILLLVGLQLLSKWNYATEYEGNMLVSLMTYALLGSLMMSSALQMVLSRYTADLMYFEKYDKVMPSLYGGVIALMVIGGPLYGLLMLFSPGIFWADRLLSWFLFMELLLVWLQMTYITAVKDYKKILIGFGLGVASAFMVGLLLMYMELSTTTALLMAVFIGYGVMAVSFTEVLHSYFPKGKGSLFLFAEYIGRYPSLIFIGLFSMLGIFSHIVIMWWGPQGVVLEGLIKQSPTYDIAAFYAYLVTVPTTINFVVSVEVNFYRKYRQYFALVDEGGTLPEIRGAKAEMITVLKQELFSLAQVQVFFMIVYMVAMRYYLKSIGFSEQALHIFRMLCIGYSAYSIGNSLMLLLLYFDDRKGALATVLIFSALNGVLSFALMWAPPVYCGLGLIIASFVMYVVGLMRLLAYVNDIDFHVFCGQPIFAIENTNFFKRLAYWLESRRPSE